MHTCIYTPNNTYTSTPIKCPHRCTAIFILSISSSPIHTASSPANTEASRAFLKTRTTWSNFLHHIANPPEISCSATHVLRRESTLPRRASALRKSRDVAILLGSDRLHVNISVIVCVGCAATGAFLSAVSIPARVVMLLLLLTMLPVPAFNLTSSESESFDALLLTAIWVLFRNLYTASRSVSVTCRSSPSSSWRENSARS